MASHSGQGSLYIMNKRIAYITLGCKLNYAETSTYERELAKEGFEAVPWSKGADVFLVNTCTVTEHSDKKSRNIIRKLHRQNPEALIFVTGCYAQLKKAEIEAIEGVTAVFGATEKSAVVPSILARTNGDECCGMGLSTFFPAYSSGERTRSFLKVQDGCDCWCTYCTIPAARGRSRSGTVAQMVAQAQQAADSGAREIVITGVNIGDFGRRQPDALAGAPRETFLDLIKALDTVEGIARYRISSIEPDLLTDEIIEYCARSRAFMPHFHIPLQCGSDAVLKLMRRRYDTALFRDKILKINSLIPDAFIGIDLICGARGETAEEFIRSRQFIESLPITRLHIFPYSERPGTRALEITHVVPQEEKHRRVEEMIGVSDRRFLEFARRFTGTVRPVLLEHTRAGQPMAGFTDNYLKVRIPDAPQSLDNHIADVRLTEILPFRSNTEVEFLGEIVNPEHKSLNK